MGTLESTVSTLSLGSGAVAWNLSGKKLQNQRCRPRLRRYRDAYAPEIRRILFVIHAIFSSF